MEFARRKGDRAGTKITKRSFAEYITDRKVYTKVIGRCGFCRWTVIVAIIKTKTDIKIFEELITRIYLQIPSHVPNPKDLDKEGTVHRSRSWEICNGIFCIGS